MDTLPLGLAQSPPSVSAAHCWSNLPLDLMQLVFERLGFADFERAKSVCSSWRYGSRQSQPNNQIPWMISFPTSQNYCLLFNPEEKEKLYRTRHLGDDFEKSFYWTTHRSWLLMNDGNYNDFLHLYILNIITGERINLPAFESECWFLTPVFWIDEKTKEYLVIKMFSAETMIFLKKRDESWKKIPHLSFSGIDNMVYKDHKLYCLVDYELRVVDFSGEVPLLVFKISIRGCMDERYPNIKNVVVTLSGNILVVKKFRQAFPEIWKFRIYKLKGNKEWEEIVSLGDEAILLDLGTTVLAKNIHGVKKNSIFTVPYCKGLYADDDNDIFVFNLDTNKVEKPQEFVSPPFYSRWFLPSFKTQ